MNPSEDRGDRASRARRVGSLEGQLSPEPASPAGAAGDRPAYLRPSVEPFPTPDGELFLLRPGDPDLRISDAEPSDRAIVAALAQRPWTVSGLARELGLDVERVREKLDALASAGVLTRHAPSGTALDASDTERFSRQLPYLVEGGDADELQARLRRSTVLVIGCGGLGTWSLAALASAGVGRFVLVDDDVVELSNLNRQILYGEPDLGVPKVEASARWLRQLDSRITVEAHVRRIRGEVDLRDMTAESDVVVVAADWPPYVLARWVNAACASAGLPFVLAGQSPPILKIGPIYWPGRTACFVCHEHALRDASPYYDDYVALSHRTTPRSATLGPASGIVGATLGMELLHLLTSRRPATLGATVTVDLRTLQTRREVVPRAPSCPACQHLD